MMSPYFMGNNDTADLVFHRSGRKSPKRLELIKEGCTSRILHRYNGPVWGSYLLFIMITILCPKETLSYCKCSTFHTEAPLELEKCSEGATPVYCFYRKTNTVYVRFTGCSDCYPAKPPYVSPVPMPPFVSGPNHSPPVLSHNSTTRPPCPCTSYYPRIPSDCSNTRGGTLCTRNGKVYWTGRLEPKPGSEPVPACPDVPQTCWITSDTSLPPI